jgi:hypothetical protein
LTSEQKLKRKIASAENMAVRQRNYRRARDRALARLAQNYKEEYLELLAEEKEKDEAEGKRWHYLANSGADLWTTLSGHLEGKTGGDTATPTTNKGNDV